MADKPTGKIFDDDMLIRNRRIKTTAAIEDSLIEADDKEAFYDGNSEAEYLQYNRRVTKKNDQSRRFRIKTQARWMIACIILLATKYIIINSSHVGNEETMDHFSLSPLLYSPHLRNLKQKSSQPLQSPWNQQ